MSAVQISNTKTYEHGMVGEEDLITGEDVLPGFECKVQDFFVDLDQIEAQ